MFVLSLKIHHGSAEVACAVKEVFALSIVALVGFSALGLPQAGVIVVALAVGMRYLPEERKG
jgi:hypothetical protein